MAREGGGNLANGLETCPDLAGTRALGQPSRLTASVDESNRLFNLANRAVGFILVILTTSGPCGSLFGKSWRKLSAWPLLRA